MMERKIKEKQSNAPYSLFLIPYSLSLIPYPLSLIPKIPPKGAPPKMYHAILFDMDGTILDTLTDLTLSTNYALQEMGLPHDFPAELVKLCYGSGITADMEKAFAMAKSCPAEDLEFIGNQIPLSTYGFDAADVKKLESLFVPYYSAHCHDHSAPYAGIISLLETLRARGLYTAVASNKNENDVLALVESQFAGLFHVSMGNHPAIRRKPAPDMIESILQKLGVSKEEAIYIGDSEVDIETAKNAGIPSISVTWGFRNRKFLENHGAERIVETAGELREMLLEV